MKGKPACLHTSVSDSSHVLSLSPLQQVHLTVPQWLAHLAALCLHTTTTQTTDTRSSPNISQQQQQQQQQQQH